MIRNSGTFHISTHWVQHPATISQFSLWQPAHHPQPPSHVCKSFYSTSQSLFKVQDPLISATSNILIITSSFKEMVLVQCIQGFWMAYFSHSQIENAKLSGWSSSDYIILLRSRALHLPRKFGNNVWSWNSIPKKLFPWGSIIFSLQEGKGTGWGCQGGIWGLPKIRALPSPWQYQHPVLSEKSALSCTRKTSFPPQS